MHKGQDWREIVKLKIGKKSAKSVKTLKRKIGQKWEKFSKKKRGKLRKNCPPQIGGRQKILRFFSVNGRNVCSKYVCGVPIHKFAHLPMSVMPPLMDSGQQIAKIIGSSRPMGWIPHTPGSISSAGGNPKFIMGKFPIFMKIFMEF